MPARLYYPAARAILHVVFDSLGDSEDDEEAIIPILPKRATVHCNSYQQADSWEMTFEANDLPIDPSLVRGGSAEIYLFQILPGMEAAHAVVSRQFATEEEGASQLGDSLASLEATKGSKAAKDRFTLGDKPRIVGLFDEQDMDLSDDGKWVTISGQDYTAFLIAKQWPPTARGTARRIPTGRPLDVILRGILAEADPSSRLTLVTEGLDPSRLPVVGKSETSTNGQGIPVQEDTSYWDVMYKLAVRHGFILFVRGLDVVLAKPKNITNLATHDIKKLAWGHNIQRLNLKRHLGKEKVPRIILKAYDDRARKAIVVEYPPFSKKGQGKYLRDKPKKKTTTIERIGLPKSPHAPTAKPTQRESDEFMIIPVYGITDREILRRAAETRYHLLGHSERQIVATTNDLTDMGSPGASLLELSTGDAVDIEWQLDRELLINKSEEARYEHLVAHGYNPEVAAVIAKHYTKLVGEKRPLRVHEVTYEFSVTDGLQIEMQLNDFVVVDGLRHRDDRQTSKQKRRDRVRDASGRSVGNDIVEGR